MRLPWIGWVFVFSGLLTGGAVFRVGIHTFFGWGTPPISDRAAQVDELPETKDVNREMPWWLSAPPLVCISAAIGFFLVPNLRWAVLEAAHRMTEQASNLHAVYTGTTVVPPMREHPELAVTTASMCGALAAFLAILLALTSVFRARLARALRLGGYLEGPLVQLRTLQSGHAGDYVAWLTVGAAIVAGCFVIFMR